MLDDDGGPAFPLHRDVLPGGMSLRDYFAAQVLPVLLHRNETTIEDDADEAYRIADALLAARLRATR